MFFCFCFLNQTLLVIHTRLTIVVSCPRKSDSKTIVVISGRISSIQFMYVFHTTPVFLVETWLSFYHLKSRSSVIQSMTWEKRDNCCHIRQNLIRSIYVFHATFVFLVETRFSFYHLRSRSSRIQSMTWEKSIIFSLYSFLQGITCSNVR